MRDRRRAAAATGVVTATEHTWYPRLSGLQNLEFFAGLAGMRRRSARSAAARALEDAALGPHADKPVGAYLRGMRGRLAIARAWLGDPSVLLLDEPTAGLDAGSAAAFHAQIGRWRRGAVLLATHSAPEAARLADRALVLDGGRLVRELPGPLNETDLADALGAD